MFVFLRISYFVDLKKKHKSKCLLFNISLFLVGFIPIVSMKNIITSLRYLSPKRKLSHFTLYHPIPWFYTLYNRSNHNFVSCHFKMTEKWCGCLDVQIAITISFVLILSLPHQHPTTLDIS